MTNDEANAEQSLRLTPSWRDRAVTQWPNRSDDVNGTARTEGVPDFGSRFCRFELPGIDRELRDRHLRRAERTPFTQLPIKLQRGEFFLRMSRGVRQPALGRRLAAGQFYPVDGIASSGGVSSKTRDEFLRDGTLGIEREDHSLDPATTRAIEYVEPDFLAQIDKGLAAKFEYGQERIDDQVIVEKFPLTELVQFARDRQFADGGISEKYD